LNDAGRPDLKWYGVMFLQSEKELRSAFVNNGFRATLATGCACLRSSKEITLTLFLFISDLFCLEEECVNRNQHLIMINALKYNVQNTSPHALRYLQWLNHASDYTNNTPISLFPTNCQLLQQLRWSQSLAKTRAINCNDHLQINKQIDHWTNQ